MNELIVNVTCETNPYIKSVRITAYQPILFGKSYLAEIKNVAGVILDKQEIQITGERWENWDSAVNDQDYITACVLADLGFTLVPTLEV